MVMEVVIRRVKVWSTSPDVAPVHVVVPELEVGDEDLYIALSTTNLDGKRSHFCHPRK